MAEFKLNKKSITVIIIVASILLVLICSAKLVNTVSKGTYQIKQAAVSGTMSAKMTPGIWLQLWGDIDTWPKAFTFYFTHDRDTSVDSVVDQSVEIRFVDGSKCRISGTARIAMPTVEEDAIAIVTEHGYMSLKAVEEKLIKPTIRNSLRLTANMMTAQESYAEKRLDYNNWAREQLASGLYEVETEMREVTDLASGEKVKKPFKVIKTDKEGNALHRTNPLEGTGIVIKNFEIKSFEYDPTVRDQIGRQQKSLMAVATAKADAQKAEQEKLTIEAQGKAKVAKAKYEEEQKKIRAVVEAEKNKEVQELNAARDKQVAVIAGEQRKEVAVLDRDAAKLTKQQQILLGQGEAERKRLVLKADGALAQKLETYENVMKVWADAFSVRPVPSVMMGGSGGKAGVDGDALGMSDVLSLIAMKQLGLDLTMPSGNRVSK